MDNITAFLLEFRSRFAFAGRDIRKTYSESCSYYMIGERKNDRKRQAVSGRFVICKEKLSTSFFSKKNSIPLPLFLKKFTPSCNYPFSIHAFGTLNRLENPIGV